MGNWHERAMIELSDELLVAYVDGELTAPERAAVKARLKDDEAARDKVRSLEETAKLLRMAFEDEPVATVTPLHPRIGRHRLARAPVLTGVAAAAAVVVLMVGTGLVGTPWKPDERAHFMADVAAYHALYAAETEHLVEVPAERQAHIEEWLGARLKRTLSVPDLSSQGWKFEGGRLLAEGGNPIAQLLYTAPGRQPIAVCVTFSDRNGSSPVRYDPGDGLQVMAWDDRGYLYMVVGALVPTELERITGWVRNHFGIG
jgi:anti-sigma factor RsiW